MLLRLFDSTQDARRFKREADLTPGMWVMRISYRRQPDTTIARMMASTYATRAVIQNPSLVVVRVVRVVLPLVSISLARSACPHTAVRSSSVGYLRP